MFDLCRTSCCDLLFSENVNEVAVVWGGPRQKTGSELVGILKRCLQIRRMAKAEVDAQITQETNIPTRRLATLMRNENIGP